MQLQSLENYLLLNLMPLLHWNLLEILKCLAHIAGHFEKHAFVKLLLITGFALKFAAHFLKQSGLEKDTNYALWQARSYQRFLYSTEERFFFHGKNTLIAYIEFDNLKQIVSETAISYKMKNSRSNWLSVLAIANFC